MDENKKASFVEMPKDKRHAITIALISLASKAPSGMLDQKTLTADEVSVMGTLAKKRGMSVVFISSEMDEMVRTCTKLIVLRDRRKVAELEKDEISSENVMRAIAGGEA